MTLLVGVREKIFTRTGTRKNIFCVPPTTKKQIAYRYTKFSHTPRCHIGVHDLATQARHRPRLLSRRQRSLQTEERSYPGATDRPNYQQAWRVDIFFAYRYARSWRVETACPDHLERPGASGQLVRTFRSALGAYSGRLLRTIWSVWRAEMFFRVPVREKLARRDSLPGPSGATRSVWTARPDALFARLRDLSSGG